MSEGNNGAYIPEGTPSAADKLSANSEAYKMGFAAYSTDDRNPFNQYTNQQQQWSDWYAGYGAAGQAESAAIEPLPNDRRYMADEIVRLRTALAGAIAAWNKWYELLPVAAEDDEFGAFLDARSALEMTQAWMFEYASGAKASEPAPPAVHVASETQISEAP